MPIDVSAEQVIPLPPGQVAAYAMDWRHDAWEHLPCPLSAMWEAQGIHKGALTREADGGGFGV
jgi:hypothetical protein